MDPRMSQSSLVDEILEKRKQFAHSINQHAKCREWVQDITNSIAKKRFFVVQNKSVLNDQYLQEALTNFSDPDFVQKTISPRRGGDDCWKCVVICLRQDGADGFDGLKMAQEILDKDYSDFLLSRD